MKRASGSRLVDLERRTGRRQRFRIQRRATLAQRGLVLRRGEIAPHARIACAARRRLQTRRGVGRLPGEDQRDARRVLRRHARVAATLFDQLTGGAIELQRARIDAFVLRARRTVILGPRESARQARLDEPGVPRRECDQPIDRRAPERPLDRAACRRHADDDHRRGRRHQPRRRRPPASSALARSGHRHRHIVRALVASIEVRDDGGARRRVEASVDERGERLGIRVRRFGRAQHSGTPDGSFAGRVDNGGAASSAPVARPKSSSSPAPPARSATVRASTPFASSVRRNPANSDSRRR